MQYESDTFLVMTALITFLFEFSNSTTKYKIFIMQLLNSKIVIGAYDTAKLKQAKIIIAKCMTQFGWGLSVALFPNVKIGAYADVNGTAYPQTCLWDKNAGTITINSVTFTFTIDTIVYFMY